MTTNKTKLDEVSRRGFLKTAGAAAATAAAPAGTLKALTTPATTRPAMSSIRQNLADEIKSIYDSAMDGRDQTDHIIDELGDLWDEIEESGDEVSLNAYELMSSTIDTDPETQAEAALKAVKMLEKGVISGAASQVAQAATSTVARLQVAPAATAAATAFKELVQRVMSAGQTQPPIVKDMGQIEPAKPVTALPAPDQSAADIMRDLQDRLNRSLTDQEKSIVKQELSKREG